MKEIRVGRIRIGNGRTVCYYFAACILLLFVTPGAESATDIWGGFSPRGGGDLDILDIMRWNLAVIPPVAASMLYIDREWGSVRIYTLLRSGSVGKWCAKRFGVIVVLNLLYLLVCLAAAALCNIWTARDFYTVCGFPVIFYVHTVMISLLSVMLLLKSGKPQASVLFYLVAEGAMAVVGSVSPQISGFLLPFWGMSAWECSLIYRGRVLAVQVILSVAAGIFSVRTVHDVLRGK